MFSSLFPNRTAQASTIWTMINLGYADSEYSEAEKEVITFLTKKWKIDPLLVAELTDTADAVQALTIQKQWLQTSRKSKKEIKRITEELDKSIASMFANVKIAISEADIA